MLVKTERFKKIFGNDNFAVMLAGCNDLFTRDNLELIRGLTNEMVDSLPHADKTTSPIDTEFMMGGEDGIVIEQVVPDTTPTDPKQLEEIRRKAYMKPHVAERLAFKDGTLSWIIFRLRTFPRDPVWNKGKNLASPEVFTDNELGHTIIKDKYKTLHPKGAGLLYVTAMEMKWARMEMPRVMGITTLVLVLILLLMTRSFRGVVVPLLTAISPIIVIYEVLGYVGVIVDSGIVMILMLLTFAVPIAYNIHVYSYFKRRFLIHGLRK